ncbi:hypothetical protein [Nisaea nitritireducens]|uniref:hypothetical protein n=1 Tax=Nisaea nitritireducens TaxID=568392 RepID=UPI0018671291|nr:hypothetical protein [Nisaea nitritireducens]
MRSFLLLLIVVSLSGCGGAVQKTASTGRVQQPISAEKSVAAVTQRAEAEDSASVASLAVPDSPRAPDFSDEERDPSRLLDLGQHDLSSILGKPAFIRRDMSAVVWQYRTDACVLDLFLYELGRDLAVTYYEFRPRRDVEIVRDDCFVNLLQRGVSRAAQS